MMKEKLLHTPEGVRDIYNEEYKRKETVTRRMERVLSLFGYQKIATPTFEFFDIFNSDTGTVGSREMYKFFDRYNNTLVLRPDMTPSIARCAAKYYSDTSWPLRLSYVGNTFLNNENYKGKLAEKTELGAEHINDDSPEADAEGIIMMIECLMASGLTEFRIDIGQVDFYKSIMESLPVDEAARDKIHDLVLNKNSLGLEQLLSELPVPGDLAGTLSQINELYGGVEILDKAAGLTRDERCQRAVNRLKEIYEIICIYGYEKYITFDLGMVNYFDYYTGVIFHGYTFGTGDAIGKGGRYDGLLSQFGMEAPSIGFTILVDDLMSALERQKIEVSIKDYRHMVLLYEKEDRAEAISLAAGLRGSGICTELTCINRDSGREPQEHYHRLSYIKSHGAYAVMELKGEDVKVTDLATGKVETRKLADFREEY